MIDVPPIEWPKRKRKRRCSNVFLLTTSGHCWFTWYRVCFSPKTVVKHRLPEINVRSCVPSVVQGYTSMMTVNAEAILTSTGNLTTRMPTTSRYISLSGQFRFLLDTYHGAVNQRRVMQTLGMSNRYITAEAGGLSVIPFYKKERVKILKCYLTVGFAYSGFTDWSTTTCRFSVSQNTAATPAALTLNEYHRTPSLNNRNGLLILMYSHPRPCGLIK